ncbi:unnamed protein product [Larinioides sclopetarius]
MTMCTIYPLLALTSDTGLVSIYNWIANEILCTYSYSLSATAIIWPNPKLDGVGASLIVGFDDGTLRWLNLVKEDEKQTGGQNLNLMEKGKNGTIEESEKTMQETDETKASEEIPDENLDLDASEKQEISASDQLLNKRSIDNKEHDNSSKHLKHKNSQQIADDEKEEDEVYNLKLQAVTKPHTNTIYCLGVNEESLCLVSQGLDSKLFFYNLKDYNFIPLGFYINNHLVNSFEWLNYGSNSEIVQDTKGLLMFCKDSYIVEVNIPNIFPDEADDFRLSYCIEKFNCQLYRINGLLKYHELGDRISDINLDEVSDVGKDVLINLKYNEKKKKREAREQMLGISGPSVPPKILCHLPSKFPGRLWLSFGKNDSGYLFEFQFIKEYQDHPIEFMPCRAVEIITANFVPIISMNFSVSGKYLYMGLEDGTLHYCHLQEPFEPSSSYGFEKLESPDPTISRVEDAYASPDGSLLTRCGDGSNRIEFILNMVGHKDIIEYGALPSFSSESSKEIEDINGEDLLSLEENLQSDLSKKYNQKREGVIEKLEALKIRYVSFKEEYDAYLKECYSSLKYRDTIPEELQLNTEIVSCCPKAVKLFKDKTKVLQKELDKEYERDLVKTSLIKQKYLECFKSRIVQEKIFVEESDKKVHSYRECIMPAFSKNLPTKHQQVYGKKVDKKEDSEELSVSKPDTDRKNKKTDKLKQRLTSIIKDLIEYPEDGPVSDIVLKYNKRKQDLTERLKQHR